jgi:hypothetical protein
VTPRLATSILVTAMLRRAEGEGGFGAVLAKGDATSGSILVILLERGQNPRIYERVLQADERYDWVEPIGQSFENKQEVPAFVARRRRFDPDLWVLELDVPSAERFAAEMNQAG